MSKQQSEQPMHLAFCESCGQMTNHRDGACLKHGERRSSGWLSVAAEDVLARLYSDAEYCYGYKGIGGKTPENIAAIKELKEHDMLEYYRGLMNEEGEMGGSGWCRSRKGNEYVEEFNL